MYQKICSIKSFIYIYIYAYLSSTHFKLNFNKLGFSFLYDKKQGRRTQFLMGNNGVGEGGEWTVWGRCGAENPWISQQRIGQEEKVTPLSYRGLCPIHFHPFYSFILISFPTFTIWFPPFHGTKSKVSILLPTLTFVSFPRF